MRAWEAGFWVLTLRGQKTGRAKRRMTYTPKGGAKRMAKLSRVIALTGSAVVAGMGFSADRGEKIFDDDKVVVQKEVEQCLEQGRFDVARSLAKGNPELAKVVLHRSRAEKRAARRAKVARGIARRAKLAADQKKVVEENKAPRKGPPKLYQVQLTPDRRTKFYEVRS